MQTRPQDEQHHHQQQQQQNGRQEQQEGRPPSPPPPSAACAAPDPAAIVRQACDLLALPSRVACTALTFLRRMDPGELPAERLAAACVFLAAKVEEASVRTNDMVNAVAAWRPAAAGAAAALAAFPCLVGEAYQAAKRQLILDEQLLLRRLRFDIGVDQPHRHLCVLAQCWGASAAAVRAAVCLLNDALGCCPAYGSAAMQPATAAAAALHLGALLCGQEVQPAGWWRAAGISDQGVSDACMALLEMLGA